MSASEKLRALEHDLRNNFTTASQDEWSLYAIRLQDALPQIVAMAKAMEQVNANAKSWHGPEPDMGHVRALAVIAEQTDAALAALSTALEGADDA